MALVVNFRGDEVQVAVDGAGEELLTVGESSLGDGTVSSRRTARWRCSRR